MRFLGIDPGLATTGYGLVERTGPNGVRFVECGIIRTPAGYDLGRRLVLLHNDLARLVDRLRPDHAAVERFFARGALTTAVKVSHARGVLVLGLTLAGLPPNEYTPVQVKQTVTGYGKAGKKQVQLMVQRLLKLDRLPQPDDAADALAVALCDATARGMTNSLQAALKRGR